MEFSVVEMKSKTSISLHVLDKIDNLKTHVTLKATTGDFYIKIKSDIMKLISEELITYIRFPIMLT